MSHVTTPEGFYEVIQVSSDLNYKILFIGISNGDGFHSSVLKINFEDIKKCKIIGSKTNLER